MYVNIKLGLSEANFMVTSQLLHNTELLLNEMKGIVDTLISEEKLSEQDIRRLTKKLEDLEERFRGYCKYWFPFVGREDYDVLSKVFYNIRQKPEIMNLFKEIVTIAKKIDSIQQKELLHDLFDKTNKLLEEINKNKIKHLKGGSLYTYLFIYNPKIFYTPCGPIKQHKREYFEKILELDHSYLDKICSGEPDFKLYLELMEKSHRIAKKENISMLEFFCKILSRELNENITKQNTRIKNIFLEATSDEIEDKMEISSCEELLETINVISNYGQLIIYGPIGTGKTFTTVRLAKCIVGKKDLDELIEYVTFHPSYEYEDFVEGLFPEVENGEIKYYVRNGIFKKMALQATIAALKKVCSGESMGSESLKELCEDPCFKKIGASNLKEYLEQIEKKGKCIDMIMDCEKWRGFKDWDSLPKFVLVIDEINRADLSRVFGELITLLEKDKRLGGENCITVTLPYSREKFGVPPNLYIIGTMNTTDRSIALIDLALRRRFAFKEIEPDPSILEGVVVKDINIGELLKKLNERIKNEKGRDYQIGHAFFIELMKDGLKEEEKERLLIYIWNNKVAPLLEEIFYGRNDLLRNVVGGHLYDRDRVKRIDDVEELKKL